MAPVIISRKWISKPYEDFGNCFRIPANLAAQPPLVVAKTIPTSISFPFLIVVISIFIYLV
jgi:hypothetical protein